jgi:hypothetical protein
VVNIDVRSVDARERLCHRAKIDCLTASGKLLATLALDTVVANVAFSPRGRMLAAGCLKDARSEHNKRAVWLQGKEGVVRIWDVHREA